MKGFVLTNKGLGHLGLLVPSRSSFYFKFCMFFIRVSHSKASYRWCFKVKTFICQSTCILCRTSQDNPMMTTFLGNEMTLKTTLFVWEPMVTSNGLVSCVISLDERFQPSMTSIDISVFFSTRTNLYYHTNSLSIKHVDVLKSIVTSLLHLMMIGTKKHGARFENRLGPFSLHDASRSNLIIPTKTRHVHFLIPLVVDW